MVTLYIFSQKNISRPLTHVPSLFIGKLGLVDTFQAVMGYFICHEVMPTRIYNNWRNYDGHNYVSKPPKKKNKGTQGHTLQKEQKIGSNFMMKIFDKKIVNLERRVIAQIQRLKYCSLITPYYLRSSLIMIFFLVIIFHQSSFSLELFEIMKLMKIRLECVH